MWRGSHLGTSGSQVVVSFAGQSARRRRSGRKMACQIAPMTVSARSTPVTGDGTKIFSDVLVGDIWLCRQSMQWCCEIPIMWLISSPHPKDTIRLLSIPLVWSRDPDDVKEAGLSQSRPAHGSLRRILWLSATLWNLGSDGLDSDRPGRLPSWIDERLDSFDPFHPEVGEAVRNGSQTWKPKGRGTEKDKQRLPTALYNAMVHRWNRGCQGMLVPGRQPLRRKSTAKAQGSHWAGECLTLPIYIVQIPPWQYGNTKIPNFWLAQHIRWKRSNAYFIVWPIADRQTISTREQNPACQTTLNQSLQIIRIETTRDATNIQIREVKDDKVASRSISQMDSNPETEIPLRSSLAGAEIPEATGFACNDQLIVSSPEVGPLPWSHGIARHAQPRQWAGHPVAPFEQKL